METFPISDKSRNYPVAFEIENAFISYPDAARLLSKVSGVSDVQPQKNTMFMEIKVEFNYQGKSYIVSEPFGDNSRYWIGPKDALEGAMDITDLDNVFKSYRPSLFERIIGTLLTLKFRKHRKFPIKRTAD